MLVCTACSRDIAARASLIAERNELAEKLERARQQLLWIEGEISALGSVAGEQANLKDEALVCKHCTRDLRAIRPLLFEIQDLVVELDRVRLKLDRARTQLERLKHPWRVYRGYATLYLLLPLMLLVIAHVVITIVLNISPVFLRLASAIIPVPFGFLVLVMSQVRLRGAFAIGLLMATGAVALMQMVTGIKMRYPSFLCRKIPVSQGEWREAAEYATSICLALVTGNILGILILEIIPSTLAKAGRPSRAAFAVASVWSACG